MTPAIVLAGGKSTRMGGRTKANLPLAGGDTFLTRIVRTLLAADVDDIVVVVGAHAEAIMRAFAGSGLPARFVENEQYESGQLSSLWAGLRVVDRPGIVATLVTPVDVPFFSVATVRAVLDHYRKTRAPIVRPTIGERHGHPVLFDRSLFDALRNADPAVGARPVVRAHATPEGDVVVDDEGAFADVDTPAEYEERVRVFDDR